ncbi:FAD/NAD(P)-binding oxidoreductase [candidate division KSB3 bacterium]|uniref:FAD/NAD(P)-binding oxidoreductase n=1 Tax=candidate division KSB3 bacterium TaxID=2044937 RepID=A0A2G6KDD5_9BACT|nr:MAG: FAD/NAD(P)-binding oxidoreductase [candidate division KSB3 bacterium]
MIHNTQFDVSIIGGGVIGCAIARELSRYRLKVAVFEKSPDVGWGTSCRNSGVVHAGFNNQTGSLMARLCVEGNQTFEAFCRPLDVPYDKQGKLVVARQKNDLPTLERLKKQGDANGVKNLSIIDAREMNRLEPNVQGIAALYSPETAITSPYLLTIALAENALENGTQFFLNTTVDRITPGKKRGSSGFSVSTNRGIFTSDYIINSAGLYADKIAAMVGMRDYRIYPCRGEYHILDKNTSSFISRPVYPAPVKGDGGLGVHFTTTVGGVLLIGPSAEYIRYRDNLATTRRVMKLLFDEAQSFLPFVSPQDIIRSYSGLRAKQAPPSEGGFREYVIEESRTVSNFINLIGIESPGLTASEPIAKMVTAMIDQKETLEKKPDFIPTRPGFLKFSDQNEATQRRLIQQNPDYGEIICRCENITKQEVLDAVRNPLGAKTLNSIKYRTRAMMGRCQGGYCLTRLVDILMQEFGLALEDVLLGEKDSALFTGYRS